DIGFGEGFKALCMRANSDFVSAQAFRTAANLGRLRVTYMRRYRPHDAASQVFLNVKNVLQHSVVSLSPYVTAAKRINELPCHPNAGSRLPDAALHNIADAQFPRHGAHIDQPALVGEAAVARDHE